MGLIQRLALTLTLASLATCCLAQQEKGAHRSNTAALARDWLGAEFRLGHSYRLSSTCADRVPACLQSGWHRNLNADPLVVIT